MTMLPENNVKCPATGFAKSCRSIVSKYECPKFVRIVGTDQNTGQPVDRCGCVDSFLPMLLIENSQQQRQTAAAVESFRNEMVKLNVATPLRFEHPDHHDGRPLKVSQEPAPGIPVYRDRGTE